MVKETINNPQELIIKIKSKTDDDKRMFLERKIYEMVLLIIVIVKMKISCNFLDDFWRPISNLSMRYM